jgi:hypothetical protein
MKKTDVLNLPNIEKLYKIFDHSIDTLPLMNGYAVFNCDQLGVGAFNFCDTIEDWIELFPSVLFIDYLTDGYDDEDFDKIVEIQKAYNRFKDKTIWTNETFKEFIDFSSKFIKPNEIRYAGPVVNLFNSENEFVSNLMNDFGKDPLENKDEYLQFLKEYCWL